MALDSVNSTMLHYEFLKIFLACFMYSINIYWAYFLFQALYKTLGCGNKDRPWNQELYLQFSYHHCDPSQVAILTTLKKKKTKEKTKVQFSSVTHSYPTLCDPTDCSTLGFPVHHQLLELAQTHVHWVGDAIQPSHPLSSPSPPALSLSQNQGLF